MQGQNPSGHCLVAKRVIAAAPPPAARSPASAAAHGALTVAIASGPFTCVDDAAYEPLDALLAQMETKKPDAVVLLGPFVDAENAVVRGDAAPLEQSFEEVFAHGVRDRLEAFLARADVDGYAPAIVLVPSTRDAPPRRRSRSRRCWRTARSRRPGARRSSPRPTPRSSP